MEQLAAVLAQQVHLGCFLGDQKHQRSALSLTVKALAQPRTILAGFCDKLTALVKDFIHRPVAVIVEKLVAALTAKVANPPTQPQSQQELQLGRYISSSAGVPKLLRHST